MVVDVELSISVDELMSLTELAKKTNTPVETLARRFIADGCREALKKYAGN